MLFGPSNCFPLFFKKSSMPPFQELSQNKLRYLRSLRSDRMRQKYHNFIVEGVKMAEEVLRSGSLELELIAALPEWLRAFEPLLEPHRNKVYVVTEKLLAQISLLTTPNKVLMVLKRPSATLRIDWLQTDLTLYLDGIQDPGNLGTILRTADWFGARQVVTGPGTVDVFNNKVVQAAMGSFLRVNAVPMNLESLASLSPEIPIYGATLDGEDVGQISLQKPAILVVGNESRGLSENALKYIHRRLRIGGAQGPRSESLNVAVATAIFLALWHYRAG